MRPAAPLSRQLLRRLAWPRNLRHQLLRQLPRLFASRSASRRPAAPAAPAVAAPVSVAPAAVPVAPKPPVTAPAGAPAPCPLSQSQLRPRRQRPELLHRLFQFGSLQQRQQAAPGDRHSCSAARGFIRRRCATFCGASGGCGPWRAWSASCAPARPLPTGNRGPVPGTTPGSGQRSGGGPRPGQPMRPMQPGGQGRQYTPRPGGPGGTGSSPANRPFEQRRGAMPTGHASGAANAGTSGHAAGVAAGQSAAKGGARQAALYTETCPETAAGHGQAGAGG